MKFQFYRLYALLILSSALIIWSFNEIHDYLQQDEITYQIDIENIFNTAEKDFNRSFINRLALDELALPISLSAKLNQGETIALTLTNNETYYYRLSNDSQQIIAFGPVQQKALAPLLTELIIFFLYASLGALALLLIWPLFRDLSKLQQTALAFGANPRKMSPSVKEGSAIYPLSSVFHTVTDQIVDFLQMHKELSRTISHEVRTPLARMRFALQLSKSELDSKYWHRLNADIDEIEQLANNYLSFAKLEHIEEQFKKSKITPKHFINTLSERFSLYQLKINITFDIQGEFAYLDRESMTIACQNLIMNALRFAKNDIRVSFICDEQYCQLRVEDDGPGFEGKRKKLFTAFSRDKDQSDSSGYGLGLYIVKKVAVWHQASLELEISQSLKGASLCIKWANNSN